jgi:hypothetical protein
MQWRAWQYYIHMCWDFQQIAGIVAILQFLRQGWRYVVFPKL